MQKLLLRHPYYEEEDLLLQRLTNAVKNTASLGIAISALSALTLLPTYAQDAATPAPPAAPVMPAAPDTSTPAPTATPVPEATTPAAPVAPAVVTPAAPATPPPAPAAAPAPPPNYGVQTNGLIDGYLMYSAQNPKGQLITGRQYDVRIKTPTLALAELNVFKNPKPGGLGWKATLATGDVDTINHGNFNGTNGTTVGSSHEAQFQNVQQLYATYACNNPNGGGVDIGKFYTPYGYEVVEANANYNYSRSLPFFILPVYHSGIRAYTPTVKGLFFEGWVVADMYNTLNEGITAPGGRPSYIGQINYTDPKGKYVAIATYGQGDDQGAGAGLNVKEKVGDFDFTYNLNAAMLIGLNYTYVDQKADNGSGELTDNGYAAYYKDQMTPKTAYALRFSGFHQDLHTNGATNPTPYEFTGTYEYKVAANFTSRLEYRHDGSNIASYLGSSDSAASGGTKKSQDTLLLAGLFTF